MNAYKFLADCLIIWFRFFKIAERSIESEAICIVWSSGDETLGPYDCWKLDVRYARKRNVSLISILLNISLAVAMKVFQIVGVDRHYDC